MFHGVYMYSEQVKLKQLPVAMLSSGFCFKPLFLCVVCKALPSCCCFPWAGLGGCLGLAASLAEQLFAIGTPMGKQEVFLFMSATLFYTLQVFLGHAPRSLFNYMGTLFHSG